MVVVEMRHHDMAHILGVETQGPDLDDRRILRRDPDPRGMARDAWQARLRVEDIPHAEAGIHQHQPILRFGEKAAAGQARRPHAGRQPIP